MLVEAEYSSINYKDALALTGNGKILRRLPLVPGIDVSGRVLESTSPQFAAGESVLVTGCGIGENTCGGYSEQVQVKAEHIVKIPQNLSPREVMIYGTAGFTAALALHQLEHNGLTPDKGEVLVTGATGGVGLLALLFLDKLGYKTQAWTRKEELLPWLEEVANTKAVNVREKDMSTTALRLGRMVGSYRKYRR